MYNKQKKHSENPPAPALLSLELHRWIKNRVISVFPVRVPLTSLATCLSVCCTSLYLTATAPNTSLSISRILVMILLLSWTQLESLESFSLFSSPHIYHLLRHVDSSCLFSVVPLFLQSLCPRSSRWPCQSMPVRCVANTGWGSRCLSKGCPCPVRMRTDSSAQGGQHSGHPSTSQAISGCRTGQHHVPPAVGTSLCSLGHQEGSHQLPSLHLPT